VVSKFWTKLSALRRTNYGLAAWLIGWNLLALFVLKGERAPWTHIVPCAGLVGLGFALILIGWHAHKV
jgi:hypothetical protein